MEATDADVWLDLLRHFKGEQWYLDFRGKYLKVRCCDGKLTRKGGGKRKNVKAFSRSSRFRMLQAGAKIDWQKIPHSLFLTLTYPDECVHYDHARRTTERYLFHRYMENHLSGKFPMLWRTEWKRRQSGIYVGELAPHMHMLVFGARYLSHHRMRKWWRDIIGAEGALCTDVRLARSAEQQSLYIAKYCAKVDDSLTLDYVSKVNSFGRHWGFKRKELIPQAPERYNGPVDPAWVPFLRKAAELHLRWYDKEVDRGFTFIGKVAEKIGIEFLQKELAGMAELWDNSQHQRGSTATSTDPC